MTKAELRIRYLGQRTALTRSEVAAVSAAVAERFFESVDLTEVMTLHCYLPIEKFNEPDTRLIFDRVWSEFPGVTTAAPRVDFGTGEMESILYSSTCPVVSNKWDINEPEGGKVITPERIDIVVVPLVCFDEAGHRVGYGKGYYDRFLARCRPDCLKVGLSVFPPIERVDDVHESDIALDLCVMPERIWNRP